MMFRSFLQDESGAITTDWVALTFALIVAAMVVIYSLFSGGITPLTNTLNQQIETGSEEFCGGSMAECDELDFSD